MKRAGALRLRHEKRVARGENFQNVEKTSVSTPKSFENTE